MKEILVIGSGNAFNMDGRAHACYLLTSTGEGGRLLLDFGATSLMRLHQEKADFMEIDGLLLTHFHGDHVAGVPFLLLHLDLILKRRAPFTILGPPGVREAVERVIETAYPSFPFSLPILFQEVREKFSFGPFEITPFPITHRPESTGYRVKGRSGKCMAFSGDSAFDEKLFELVRGVDVALVELSMPGQESPPIAHVALDEIVANPRALEAKRIVFTHIYDELAEAAQKIGGWETASDGMRILL